MARTARTAAVAPAAARAVVAPRRAPARTAAAPVAPAPIVAMIGDVAEPCGSHTLRTVADRADFANTVLASLVAFAAPGAEPHCFAIEAVAPGLYLARFDMAGGTTLAGSHAILFGTADAPAPVSAETAPAPAPVAPARPAKALPAPAVAAALKASAATARDARTPVHVHVTLRGAGTFAVDCTAADLADATAFARNVVAPRVAAYHGWPRCGVDYASRAGTTSYHGAVSHGRSRQVVDWATVPATATLAYRLPDRAGQGLARAAAPGTVADLGSRMGLTPAGSHVAAAEAKAKAAGVRLSRTDRAVAEAADAAAVAASRPVVAGRTASGHAVEAAPRLSAANQAVHDAASKGTLPAPPDFSADTHTRYRGKLAELVALVTSGDVAALEAYFINPISTSPKALNRYRNAAVIALRVRAAAKAARAAA